MYTYTAFLFHNGSFDCCIAQKNMDRPMDTSTQNKMKDNHRTSRPSPVIIINNNQTSLCRISVAQLSLTVATKLHKGQYIHKLAAGLCIRAHVIGRFLSINTQFITFHIRNATCLTLAIVQDSCNPL